MIPSHRVRISSTLEVVELDGELVVLNVDNGQYYGLNKTGALILHMAQEGATLEDVFKAFVERYDIDIDQVRGDVRVFLEAMEDYGMLRVEPAAE